MKIQRVDVNLVYAAVALSFNNVDTTSSLTNTNVNKLQAMHTNDVAAKVQSKSYIDIGLNLKANKIDTYPKAEINVNLSPNYNQSTTYVEYEVHNILSCVDNEDVS